MKKVTSAKKRCEKCKLVRRRGLVYVICEIGRHKQRQGSRNNTSKHKHRK